MIIFFLPVVETSKQTAISMYVFAFKFIFKLNLFLFIVYTIFFLTKLENYIKQIKSITILAKLFILNSSEKEVGPVDDYFFFAVLFFLTISLFIFTSVFLILIQSKVFI